MIKGGAAVMNILFIQTLFQALLLRTQKPTVLNGRVK